MPRSSTARPLARELLDETAGAQPTNEDLAAVYEASLDRIPGGLLIPIEHIEVWTGNPRSSYDDTYIAGLADSIAENGLLQAPTVRRDPHRPGFYIITTGNCRLLALRRLHSSTDPALRARFERVECKLKDQDEAEAFADAVAENVARNNLTRKEFMGALVRMNAQYGWSARSIARRIGRHHGDIAELLNVAQHPDLSGLVAADVISATTAGAILGLRPELRAEAIARVRSGRIKTVAHVKNFAAADEARRELERWRDDTLLPGETMAEFYQRRLFENAARKRGARGQGPGAGGQESGVRDQAAAEARADGDTATPGRRISDSAPDSQLLTPASRPLTPEGRRISDTPAGDADEPAAGAAATPVRAHLRTRQGRAAGAMDGTAGQAEGTGSGAVEAAAAVERAAHVLATRELLHHGLEYARGVVALDREELDMLRSLQRVIGGLLAAYDR